MPPRDDNSHLEKSFTMSVDIHTCRELLQAECEEAGGRAGATTAAYGAKQAEGCADGSKTLSEPKTKEANALYDS